MRKNIIFYWLIALMTAAWHNADAQRVDRYVVKGNPNAQAPYHALTNAAPDINTAIGAAMAENGDMVLVAPEVYDSGGIFYGNVTTRVWINKAITVMSISNDPEHTIIKGAWASSGQTNGADAVRCVAMTANATLIGFTLTNGSTASATDSGDDGGGIYFSLAGNTVSNCIITGCAARYGGGAYGGGATLYNCRLEGNYAVRGAGSYTPSIYNSIIRNNSAQLGVGNQRGGGVFGGSIYNCLIEANKSIAGAGGGGARESTLYNCTIINNIGSTGAGTRLCTLYNCISWNNTDYSDTVAYYSCGQGLIYEINSCTTNDPLFMDGSWSLNKLSPCVNTGDNNAWDMADTLDLAGNHRICYGTVDMGAYEYYVPEGTIFRYR